MWAALPPAGVLSVDGAIVPIFFGAAGATVEGSCQDGLGIAVDDGSAAVQAVDASSKIPATLRPVHRGEPCTWNSPLDSKYSEFFIQRVNASNRKTWIIVSRWMGSSLIVPTAATTARTGRRITKSCREAPTSRSFSSRRQEAGVGPRLHKHPYAETFIIRRGWATFTIGSTELQGRAGQVLVVPANTPHKFSTGPDGYEAVHIHANPRFVTEWLE